ncbi:MAG TPA: hypothetical protein VFX85_04180 [Solirubrobacterales bacterium]|nr:hypothetical protein [Solirubrobacterales bacterium]
MSPGEAATDISPQTGASSVSYEGVTKVYEGSGEPAVDTVVVDGEVLMRGGEVPGLDEVVGHAAERARRLGL